jgi:UDP-galactopyranose mutase
VVKSSVNDELYPFPVNLNTLRKFFNRPDLTPETAEQLLEEKREKIENPQNSEEYVLSKIGRELYEAFYQGYTQKQWGIHPKALDPEVCGRIPVRFNEEERYVDHKFKMMPADGYSRLFEKMLSNPLIAVASNTDFREVKNNTKPAKATVYTGPIDEYFNNMHGGLPWRSLDFKTELFNEEFHQPCAQINYPNEFEYTRAVEIKHVTRQKHAQTAVTYEFPKSYGEPFYPLPTNDGKELYEQYRVLAGHETFINNVYFAGRLAEYTYINTDEAIARGLEVFEKIKNNHG